MSICAYIYKLGAWEGFERWREKVLQSLPRGHPRTIRKEENTHFSIKPHFHSWDLPSHPTDPCLVHRYPSLPSYCAISFSFQIHHLISAPALPLPGSLLGAQARSRRAPHTLSEYSRGAFALIEYGSPFSETEKAKSASGVVPCDSRSAGAWKCGYVWTSHWRRPCYCERQRTT